MSLECEEYSEAVYGKQSFVDPTTGKSQEHKSDDCAIKVIPLIIGGTKAQGREFPHNVRPSNF